MTREELYAELAALSGAANHAARDDARLIREYLEFAAGFYENGNDHAARIYLDQAAKLAEKDAAPA